MVGNLVLHDISYQYTDSSEPLFDHFNASLSHGWTALLADNGLGKTTLAAVVANELGAHTYAGRSTAESADAHLRVLQTGMRFGT